MSVRVCVCVSVSVCVSMSVSATQKQLPLPPQQGPQCTLMLSVLLAAVRVCMCVYVCVCVCLPDNATYHLRTLLPSYMHHTNTHTHTHTHTCISATMPMQRSRLHRTFLLYSVWPIFVGSHSCVQQQTSSAHTSSIPNIRPLGYSIGTNMSCLHR